MHSRSLRTVLGMTLAQLAGAAWLVAAASVPAAAQAPQEPQQPPSQREQAPAASQASAVTSAQVQDQELAAFVKSVAQVNEVRKTLNDSAAGQQAKDQANQKMASIIQACGMNVERYNELARAMSSDPQLNQRFQATQKELADKHDLSCGSNNSGDKR